jgi:hypothetical protein
MLVNRSTHSLWRSMTDDQHSITSRGSSPPAFLAPHPSEFISLSHSNIFHDE